MQNLNFPSATKIFTLVLIFIISFSSCKKKETQPAQTTNTGGGGTTGGSTPIPSNATQFYGLFRSGVYTSISPGLPATSYTNASAYFSNQPVVAMYPASAVTVSKVFINGDSLNYNPTQKYYMAYSQVNLASETWSINGMNGIGSFSYTTNAITPSCGDLSMLPDSISKSSTFTLAINNISNSSMGSLIIYDGTGSMNGYYSTILNQGNNTVTVTPANLSSLATTTSGNIIVVLSNKKGVYFSGKDYQFSREYQYFKYIKIKS